MTRTDVSNSQDVIDSRDVIARITELTELIAAEEISEENGAEPQLDDDGRVREDIATCGECGKSWNDALISERTPAPSARCPYESVHEEIAELKILEALAEEASGSPDWKYGESMIRDSYFTRYAEQLADELGYTSGEKANSWPFTCLDWEKAADELKQDYMSVDYDGVEYWIRA